MANGLPEGFTLDAPQQAGASNGLPDGFVVDSATPSTAVKPTSWRDKNPWEMTDREKKIKSAYEDGDVKLAEFYESQSEPTQQPDGQAPIYNLGQNIKEAASGAADRVGFEAKRRYDTLKDKVTGESKTTSEVEGLPELVSTNPDLKTGAKIVATLMLIPDDAERARSLSKLGFKVNKDAKGNQIVTLPDGTKTVMNAPGLSRTDVYNVASQVAQYASPAKIAAMGKGLFGKMGLGALATGITATGQELAQEQLGGEFDSFDAYLNTALGGGAELVAPLFGRIWGKFSPKKKQSILDAKTLDDLVESGLTRDDMKALSERYKEALKLAKEEGVERPFGAQAVAGETSKDFNRPLARLLEASSANDKYAREFARKLEKEGQSLDNSLRDTFARFMKSDPRGAIEGARDTAQGILDKQVAVRRFLANLDYEQTFRNAKQVDAGPLRKQIDNLIKETAVDSRPRRELKRIKRMLTSDSYEAAIRERDKIISETPDILGAKGEVLPKITPAIPKREMDPRILQQVNWELRDLMNLKTDTTLTNAVKNRIRQVESNVTGSLNLSTGGLYSAADKRFREMSDVISKLRGGMVGEAAAKKDTTLKGLVTSVFNPKPEQIGLSKRFMDLLRKQDPAAADDLYGAYFMSKLDDLPENARPTKIMKAIFGKTEDQANMVLELAPGGEKGPAASRLKRLRKLLEISSQGDELSMRGVGGRVAVGEERTGALGVIGQGFTPFQSARRTLEKISMKNRAKLMFEASLNDEWAAELDRVLKLPMNSEEIVSQFDSLFERMLARSAEAGMVNPTAKGSIPAINAIRSSEEPQDNQSTQ